MSETVLTKPTGGWRRRDAPDDAASSAAAGAPPPEGPPAHPAAPHAASPSDAGATYSPVDLEMTAPLMRPRAAAAPDGAPVLDRDGRGRFAILAVGFAILFTIMAGRALQLAVPPEGAGVTRGAVRAASAVSVATAQRGDLLDRRGEILATSLEAYSLFADPQAVWDPQGAAAALAQVLSDVDEAALAAKLAGDGRFVWIRRGLSPRTRAAVFALGLPGLDFRREHRRVYPRGRLAAHALGFTDIDGIGAAGAERAFDRALLTGEAVALSLDLRVQFALEDVLRADRARYGAAGAVGLVTDVRTGEILAMASLPDFDPNAPARSPTSARFNRAVAGVYEMGSVFKVFTYAMALDRGVVGPLDTLDSRTPVITGAVDIRDPAPAPRDLTAREAFIRSSNVAAARLGVETPPAAFTRYLEDFGLLTPPPLELAGGGAPLTPARWEEPARATIAFGHGLAVSPVAFAAAFGAAVNGGLYVAPRLTPAARTRIAPRRVISAEASAVIAALLRENVVAGTGRRAEAEGFVVGGKTGTAEQAAAGGYASDQIIASFAAVFPADAPRYGVVVMIDRPQRPDEGVPTTSVSAAVTAAPTAGRVVARVAPLLGVPARRDPAALAAARARLAAAQEGNAP